MENKKNKEEQLNIRINQELKNSFKSKTALNGRSMSDLVSEWITNYLETNNNK